jgi:hypothetical protein
MNSKIRVVIIGTASAFLLLACSEPDEPPTGAQDTADTVSTELVEFLFVQHAQKVSLENGVLTLEGVGNDVLYFSDRPDRIVGRETLEAFIDDWDEGEESFATIPPNAIITVVRGGESFDLAVVLTEPTMVGDNSMTYNVEVLDGPDSGVGDDAAVFIDAFGLKPGGESRLGRPGRPGDPGGLRNGAEPNVSGKRGREGARKFRRSSGSLDKRL